MSLETDGVWKSGVWATTVWADGVWFEGARQIGGGGGGPLDMGEESPPIKPIVWEVEPDDRFKPYRERQARLRDQLRVALEGPQAAEVRAYVEPQATDSVTPLQERVELATLSAEQVDRIVQYYRREIERRRLAEVRAAYEARQREIDEDDEDITLLL